MEWKLTFALMHISEFNFSKNTVSTQFKFLRCLSLIKFSKYTQLKYVDSYKYIPIWHIWKHTHTSVMQSQSSQEMHFHKKSYFHKNHMFPKLKILKQWIFHYLSEVHEYFYSIGFSDPSSVKLIFRHGIINNWIIMRKFLIRN